MPNYIKTDYFDRYGAIMQFNLNKDEPIHRWYPFVEGYSSEFIKSIIEELDFIPECCLDPFSGSGTTSLELQKMGIRCYSFEVSPFMHELSSVKLRTDYTMEGFNKNVLILNEHINNSPEDVERYINFPKQRNYVEKESITKWHYDFEVMRGILDIKYAISMIKDKKYESLFRIALASILLSVSNMYRNGKCLSYKKDFVNRQKLQRKDVHNVFFKKIETEIRSDIIGINKIKQQKGKLLSNRKLCFHGDARQLLKGLDDDSIDLVITSPPYLNSRDYTDSYIDELRVLGYMDNVVSEQEYRSKTIRSHVQVKWGNIEPMNIPTLIEAYNNILRYKEEFWNDSLPDMISGYFWDMNEIFTYLYQKMRTGGKIYFNVGNSAYYKTEIKVDEIISEIAENIGFNIIEIRKARKMKASSQQKKYFDYLLESVIVMEKEPN